MGRVWVVLVTKLVQVELRSGPVDTMEAPARQSRPHPTDELVQIVHLDVQAHVEIESKTWKVIILTSITF